MEDKYLSEAFLLKISEIIFFILQIFVKGLFLY